VDKGTEGGGEKRAREKERGRVEGVGKMEVGVHADIENGSQGNGGEKEKRGGGGKERKRGGG